MDKNKKKVRKNYYKSPAAKGMFHLGLELPLEYKEPFRQLAELHYRKMEPHARFIIKREIENFLNLQELAEETENQIPSGQA